VLAERPAAPEALSLTVAMTWEPTSNVTVPVANPVAPEAVRVTVATRSTESGGVTVLGVAVNVVEVAAFARTTVLLDDEEGL